MTGLVLGVARGNVLTLFGCVRTSGVEAAALGRISGGGDITLKHYSVHLHVGVRLGDCREERLGVGVQGVIEDILLVTELDH